MSQAPHPTNRSSLRRVETSGIAVICLLAFCVGADCCADEPQRISAEVQAEAIHLSLAPEGVFSNTREDSLVLASFETAGEESQGHDTSLAQHETPRSNHESETSRDWNPSTARLAGLSGASGERQSLTDLLPRLVGVTVFVLATCAASLWLARRWLQKNERGFLAEKSTRLEVTETLSLATHSQLHVIRIDDREFLAAVNTQGIQQVVTIPPAFGDLVHAYDRQATA
ncbi:MAG: FliO/MopB family protein [Planctomycetaceae bacterium]|nr:FliO/MopB family protein [Planctomycetaceae bacterium]